MSPDIELAVDSASELIKLIKYYALEQAEDYLFPCRLVECELWTEEVHGAYWSKFWDGDFDKIGWTVAACYDYFYPI